MPKMRITALEIPAPADAATTAKVVTVPSTAPYTNSEMYRLKNMFITVPLYHN